MLLVYSSKWALFLMHVFGTQISVLLWTAVHHVEVLYAKR